MKLATAKENTKNILIFMKMVFPIILLFSFSSIVSSVIIWWGDFDITRILQLLFSTITFTSASYIYVMALKRELKLFKSQLG